MSVLAVMACLATDLWVSWRGISWRVGLYGLATAVAAPTVWAAAKRAQSWQKPWRPAIVSAAILTAVSLLSLQILAQMMDWDAQLRSHLVAKSAAETVAWVLLKAPVVVGQQVLLHWFFFPSFLKITGTISKSALASSLVFGVLHLPNPGLSILATVASLGWFWYYQTSFRMLPIIAIHLLLTTAAHGTLPNRLVHDMRVGIDCLARIQRTRPLATPRSRVLVYQASHPNYYRLSGSDAGFIRSLYRDLFRREPSEASLEWWTRRLKLETRRTVVERFLIRYRISDVLLALDEPLSLPFPAPKQLAHLLASRGYSKVRTAELLGVNPALVERWCPVGSPIARLREGDEPMSGN